MSGSPTTFLTLTSNPAVGSSPTERAKLIVKAWPKLVARIKKVWRYDRLDYAWIMESTGQGEPHLHIMLRCKYIPQAWLSKEWEKLTGAYIVDIRRITEQRGAARYVSKYTSKAPALYPHCKRYHYSQRYCKRWQKPPKAPWIEGATRELFKGSIVLLLATWKSQGWQIISSERDYLEVLGPEGSNAPPLFD